MQEPAIDTLKEIESFLRKNPSEIVTLILEDYVETPKGLSNVFKAAGLRKYFFPVSKMPKNGGDWPAVKDMVSSNQRLVVFGSKKAKESSEGIAYQWNYMVENLYGDDGLIKGVCTNRAESSPLSDRTKSLVLMNYFSTTPSKTAACRDNSGELTAAIQTCTNAAGNRWPNFLALDFYKRGSGGGSFQGVDVLNGELLCGKNDVNQCRRHLSRNHIVS